MAEKANYIAGLDIGTTKVCCVIGKRPDAGGVEILGAGIAPSLGVKRGVVNDINATVAAIVEAVNEAKHIAGIEIDSCNVGIAGGHIKSVNSKGVIAISRADKDITDKDIERVLEQAKAIALPVDREVLHTIPGEFTVDDQTGISDPRGMSGSRLEAEVHIITGAVTAAQNLIKAVRRADLKVNSLVLEPIASAKAVLTPDEMELGVIMVDIGGGTTEVAVVSLADIACSESVRVAGDDMDEAIINHMKKTYSLLIGEQSAEKIKIEIGSAYPLEKELTMEVSGRDLIAGLPRKAVITSEEIREALSEPVQAIIDTIKRTLERTEPELSADLVHNGIVMAGGGSLLRGLDTVMGQATGLDVAVTDDPLTCVARGTAVYLENLDKWDIAETSEEGF